MFRLTPLEIKSAAPRAILPSRRHSSLGTQAPRFERVILADTEALVFCNTSNSSTLTARLAAYSDINGSYSVVRAPHRPWPPASPLRDSAYKETDQRRDTVEPFVVFLELGGERLGNGNSLHKCERATCVPPTQVGAAVVISPLMLTYSRSSALSSAFGEALCSPGCIEFAQRVDGELEQFRHGALLAVIVTNSECCFCLISVALATLASSSEIDFCTASIQASVLDNWSS